jgi:hypothetical protein
MSSNASYLIGLILVRSLSGVQLFWKILHPYIVSYFYRYDLVTTEESMSPITDISRISEYIGLVLSVYLLERFGIRKLVSGSVVTLSLCLYFCLYTTEPLDFMITYGTVVGLCNGLTQMTLIWVGWDYFPNRKGLISALSGLAYLNGFLYVSIITKSINFSNNPKYYNSGQYMYDVQILNRLCVGMRTYSAVVLGLGLVGAILIREKPTEKRYENKKVNFGVLAVLKDIKVWGFFFLSLVLVFYRMWFINLYKNIPEDPSMRLSGVAAEFVSVIVCGVCYDKYHPLTVTKYFILLSLFHIGLHGIVYGIGGWHPGYCVCFIVLQLCTSCIYIIIALLTRNYFAKHYKLAFGISSIGMLAGSILAVLSISLIR